MDNYREAMKYMNDFIKFIDNKNNKFIYVLSIFCDRDPSELEDGDVIIGHFTTYEDAYLTAVNNLHEDFTICKEILINSVIDLEKHKEYYGMIHYNENHEIDGADFK